MTQTVPSHELTLARAYAVCRAIAKREAKNFYYAFVALPLERRNAICAIYAFMRQADDLADDESLPREERRRLLDAWLAAWRAACDRGGHQRSGFSRRARCHPALQDSARAARRTRGRRHHGSGSRAAPARPDTYATFADLYRYCYLVASVVGLVCIRIFGYPDPRAEKLAEETGIAFQLTNILRDVAEDAARNRVYLPLDRSRRARRFARLAASSRCRLRRPQPTSARCSKQSPSARKTTTARRATAAAHRPRKPPRAVGAGRHLPCAAQAHRARRLRRLLAPRQRAVTPKARHSRRGPCAHGLGAHLLLAPSQKIAAKISLSS